MARRLKATVCAAGAAFAAAVLTPASAAAQGPEFVPLSSGAFPQQALTWQASAVRPNVIFLDLLDDEQILFQTYAPTFSSPPPPKRVSALGYRPGGVPTQSALVGGVAGRKVKRVKVFFAGAATQKLRTTKAPAEWGFRARFFAAGSVVAPESAGLTQVVTRIKALDGKGKRLSTTGDVFTNPF